MSKYNWEVIKNRYITSNITVEELHKEFNVPLRTLFYHSNKERWIENRKNYNAKISKRIAERTARTQADLLVNEREERIKALKKTFKDNQEKINNSHELGIKPKSLETIINTQVEISKHLELLEGNPTERKVITDEEREQRLNRLLGMAKEN